MYYKSYFLTFATTVCSRSEAVQVSETVCRDEEFTYDCNLTQPSMHILWRSEILGVLLFSSMATVGGEVILTSYRAVLTGNVATSTENQNLLTSTIHIAPPLDELSFNGTSFNGSTITCEGSDAAVELSITVSIAGKTKSGKWKFIAYT